MMTSINPKNAILNNYHSNENDNLVQNTANNLFQRNNYGIEKEGINEGIANNFKFKTNANNYNLNEKSYNPPQLNSFKNLSNQEITTDKMIKNISNDYGKLNTNNNLGNNLNLNYNNQNNSINLNLGLQAKKNYSTPILNEGTQGMNQDSNYNKSFEMFDRNQQNKNNLNMGQPNLAQNKTEGNDEFYLSEIDKLKKEIANLRKNNEFLNNQLKEEQKKANNYFLSKKPKMKAKIQYYQKFLTVSKFLLLKKYYQN